MADLAVLKNHIDISIQGNSGVVSTSAQAENFFLSVSKEDVLHYTRSGNDLVIEFKNGQKLQIEDFFAYGLGFHNLVFVDEGKWLVNFTQALSVRDGSIINANIYYEELKYNDSVGALLGILAGGGAAMGIGTALLYNDDVPKRQSEKPATPSVSTVMDNTGPVIGPIKSGDVTDETQPELSGKGTPGNEITIRDGDDIIGKVIVDKDGNWKWKPDTPLGEGDHSLTASEKDKAGNESERSDPVDFEVDTIAPGALDESRMHLIDDFGLVTGEIERGGVTDDKTPTYGSEAGSVDPQDVDHINIYHTDRNGHKVYLGRAAVQADGSWSFDPNPPLSPGDYVLSARPVDKAGNEGPETSGWNFRILGDAPAQPSLDEVYDNFDPVVGKVEKGSVTNDTTPVVKGTGTAGSIITVYVMGPDGKQFVAGTTTVKSDGTWSMELTTPLGAAGDGEYIIQARAGDTAGQRSAMTGGHPVILDTTAPDVPSQPILVDHVGDVTGPVVSGGTTDDKQPAFCGQVPADEAGGTVRIYDNGRKIGEAAIGEDGSWSWTPTAPGLDDGRHAITTTVTDKAGNVSAPSDPFDFTLDTSQVGISFSHFEDNYGPITGNISSGGATDDRRPTLVGIAGKNVTVEVSYVDSHGQRIVLGVTRTDSRGHWKLIPDVDLADGHYVFTATATNNAGNTSQTDFELEIDGTAPAAPVLDRVIDDVGLVQGPISSGETTDDPTPTFHGRNGEPGTAITIRDQNGRVLGTTTVRSDGTWTITTDALSEGSNQLAITATDKVGNVSDKTHFEVVLDTTAPALSASLAAISDDTGTSSSDFITGDNTLVYTIKANGSLEAGDTVWMRIVDSNGQAGNWIRAVAKGGDIWTVDRNSDDYKLADGNYTIETVVRDAAGNEGPLSRQAVVIDTKGPLDGNVHITSYFDDTGPQTGDFGCGSFTNDRSPLLKGIGSGLEAGDIITIYQNGVRIGTTTVDANGNWSYQLDGLRDGKYVYKAVITDAAGNEGASSTEFDFTVDTIAPVANSAIIGITDDTGSSSTDFITRDHTLIISVTVDQALTERERVQISVDGGVAWHDAVFNAETGTWDLDYRDRYLANGTYTFKSRVVDAAGNWHGVDMKTVVVDDVRPSTVTQITHFSDDYGLNKYPSLPSGSYTDDTTPTLHGTISAQLTNNAVVAVYRGTRLIGYANVVDKNWSLTDTTGDLQDGHFYTYTAVVQSGAGVDGMPSRKFEIGIDSTDSNMAPQVGMGGAYATYSTALRLGANGGWVMMTDMAEFSADSRDFRDFGKPNLLRWDNLGNSGISNLYPREKLFSSYTYGDYNRDGYMDMFLTDRSYTGPTGTMFVGQADGSYKATFVFTNTLIHFGSTISIDMDGDGWLDVILGDSGVDSSTFLHNKAEAGNGDMYRGQWDLYGRGSGSAARDPLYGLFIDHELSAVDLNNDGTVDFVGHAYRGSSTLANVYDMTVLYNNGTSSATGANWSFGQTFKNVFNTSGYLASGDTYERTISLTWADLNGDGYMDLFIGQARNGTTQTADSMIFYNDGTGKLKDGQRIADGMGGKSTLAIDWDGDGHMDIVEVPEAQYALGLSRYYHNTGRVDANGQVIWDIKSVKDMGVATASGSHINLDRAKNGASAVAIDYDWDGDQDLLISRANVKEASVVISNPNTPAYGTSMHLRILNPDGSNTLYSNTVQLFDSKGRLVSSQILNPQYGTGWNDSSAIVHFYDLKENESYTAVLLRNIKGVTSNVGGLATVDGKFVSYVNESWTGLKATESYNGYVLTAENSTNTSNTNYAPGAQGIVGTGYNDTFFATKGTHTYNGGGGWVVGDGDRYWDVNSGMDIIDFKLAGTQGVIVDLGLTGDQNTGFGTVKLINIEGVYGAGGNDTFTAGSGVNIFNGRGGDDTYNLAKGGYNTLLFETIDQRDATGGNGHDTVNGFHVADFNGNVSSDRIDLSDLLIGYKAGADGAARYINGVAVINDGDNIVDYLSVRYEGNNTVLYLDRDGQGDTFESTALLTITDMQVDLATLLANHQIVV